MAHKCQISGVSRQSGHRVSHANNKTKHVFKANIQSRRIFVPELGKSLKLKVSTSMIRTIDKLGLNLALKKNGLKLSDLM